MTFKSVRDNEKNSNSFAADPKNTVEQIRGNDWPATVSINSPGHKVGSYPSSPPKETPQAKRFTRRLKISPQAIREKAILDYLKTVNTCSINGVLDHLITIYNFKPDQVKTNLSSCKNRLWEAINSLVNRQLAEVVKAPPRSKLVTSLAITKKGKSFNG